MNFSEAWLTHARKLALTDTDDDRLDEVNLRRAVSAAYYALFHQMASDAVGLLAPNVLPATNHRIQRWFEHSEMKKVCGKFLQAKLEQPLRDLIGESSSTDLQTVARSFITLQEARHRADYDLSFNLVFDSTLEFLDFATDAISAWRRIQDTPEANIFILSLLMWKNWDKER